MPNDLEREVARNPFKHGPYEVTLREDGYRVRAGRSELDLAIEDLPAFLDHGSIHRLSHATSCCCP